MENQYGYDNGQRIVYTKLTHNILVFKAEAMVNADADEGVDVADLQRCVTLRR